MGWVVLGCCRHVRGPSRDFSCRVAVLSRGSLMWRWLRERCSKVARKQEADTSPRISFLFSFFYFAFHVLDLDGFRLEILSADKGSSCFWSQSDSVKLGRARRLVYIIAG